MATKKTKQTAPAPEVLELNYQLAELPSSQHRAGLAGLVLMADWLKRLPDKQGICEITRLDAHGATLKINQQGLEDLFNEVYAASMEEKEESKPRTKSGSKEEIEAKRIETRTKKDDKGRVKERTVYIYEIPIPKGAFLTEYDPTSDRSNGQWVKLWRDLIWNIFRGVPATRQPFIDRAVGEPTTDAADTWANLLEPLDFTVQLPSTYFIGAQASNAENVPFKDRARFQFLLHFWPYVAQIYVPSTIKEGKSEISGSFALAIPDVADLEIFCEELPIVLRKRGVGMAGYRPRDAVVDLAIESALDTFRRLRERLIELEGAKAMNAANIVLGIDVVHVEKQGNNIRLLGNTRLDPELTMIDSYAQFRNSLWNPLFRRQRLLNLVNQRDWHTGFDSLMSKLPYEQTIGNSYFRRDARESFPNEVKTMNEPNNVTVEEHDTSEQSLPENVSDEALIYRVVSNYLRFKLKSKHQLEWKKEWKGIKENKPPELRKFEELKAKLAREAFLALRSRTDQDFVEYFVSTLCSVPQGMSEQRYIALTKALVEDRDSLRTLTMLALAAQTPNPQPATAQPASG